MSKYKKYTRLTEIQKTIRIKIMDLIIEKKEPVDILDTLRYIKEATGIEEKYIEGTLKQFIDTNVMVVDGEKINFIFPVSGLETNHKITLEDGRTFNAMCAIDSIGTSYTFNQNVEINSVCSGTGRKITLMIENGEIKYTNNPDLRVVHVNLEKYSEWASGC